MEKNDSIRLLLCHMTAGRVRIKAPVLCGQKRRVGILQNRLLGQKCFFRADVRAATGSIILHFTPGRMTHDAVLTAVKNQMAVLPETAGPDECKPPPVRRGWTKPFVYHLVNAVVLGGLLFYALLRRFLFRSPLSQRPFSFTGAAAIIGTFPLFYRALSSLRSQGIGLFP